MKRLIYTFPVIILLIVLFTHFPAKTVNPPPATHYEEGRLPENLPANIVEVRSGETFPIQLKSNPTTGYRWELETPLIGQSLEFAGNNYEADKTGLVGSGGTETWTFKARRAGETTVDFKYVRPWEKDMPPVEKKSFVIIIKE